MSAILLLLLALTQAAAATGEIRGRVVDKETGGPIARATVRLMGRDNNVQLVAASDADGVYRFTDVPTGEYGGMVTATRYQLQSLTAYPATLRVTAGQILQVATALPRTYAIDVRVIDSFGDPLSRIPMTVRSVDGRFAGAGGAAMMEGTDDRGHLRIFGLPPGKYIVCAGAMWRSMEGAARGERLLRTCYPSAERDDEAQPITVTRADVAVEIRMRRRRTFTVSGTILGASGLPAAIPAVSLSHYEAHGSGSSDGLPVNRDGSFRIAGVHPGGYAIEARLDDPDRPNQDHAIEAALQEVRVDDADVENLVVTMRRTVDVHGRFTLEDPNATLPPALGSGLMISARLVDEHLAGEGSSRTAIARQDRTFTLSGMFGSRVIEWFNVPRGWYVKAAKYGDNDVLDEPVEFKGSANAPQLEVVLSNRGAAITGTAMDDTRTPIARANVTLLRVASTARLTVAATVTTGATGGFRIGPLRDGEYIIVALPPATPPLERGDWQRLDRLAALGERLTLGDLDTRTMQLRVVSER